MTEQTDHELLRAFARAHSEPAFAELVRRHVALVHSAARRIVADQQLAEDVTQRVFLTLAQNAAKVANHPVPTGWLHRTATNLAANVVRADVRRQLRETEAVHMHELLSPMASDEWWPDIAPHIDAALNELDSKHRDAVLLRYFQGKTAREIAAILGISAEAAQKRIARATDRLEAGLARRGVSVGAATLVASLTANSVEAAPAGLALKILTANALLAATSAAASTALLSLKVFAMTTTQKIIIGAAFVLAIGGGIYKSLSVPSPRVRTAAIPKPPPYKFQPRLTQAEQDRSKSRPATLPPRATPPKVVLINGTAARPFTSTKLYQLLQQKEPQLSRSNVEAFLLANDRNVMSLLAAYRTTGDKELLTEALNRFPDDPQVKLEALIQSDVTPSERRQLLDSFKKADSENSLPNYFAALDAFKRGAGDDVVRELLAAAAKEKFQDYSVERADGNEKAYVAAGYSASEAKVIANNFLKTPQLLDFVDLGKYMVDMAESYRQSGDETSRRNALQLAMDLGKRFSDPSSTEPLLNQITGMRIERAALEAMDPNRSIDATGKTAQQRIEELAQRKESFHTLTQQADHLWEGLSEQEWYNYYYLRGEAGEEAALQWLIGHR